MQFVLCTNPIEMTFENFLQGCVAHRMHAAFKISEKSARYTFNSQLAAHFTIYIWYAVNLAAIYSKFSSDLTFCLREQ